MKFVMVVVVALLAGCATPDGNSPFAGQLSRQFDAPLARVKPAFVATVSSMGLRIAALEVHGGREVLRARNARSEVDIELDPVSRTATRARVAARSGGHFYDDDLAARVLRQAEKILAGR